MIPDTRFFNVHDVGASQNGVYAITFPVFKKTNVTGSGHWVKVYLEDPTLEGRWLLQDEGTNLDYEIRDGVNGSELTFHHQIDQRYKKILIVSDLPITIKDNFSPDHVIDGAEFQEALDKVYALLRQSEICCLRSVKTTEINKATGSYYDITIDNYKAGDLLAFDSDTSQTRIIPSGYSIQQLQLDKTAILKALTDAQAAATQAAASLATVQAQAASANTASSSAQASNLAAQKALTDALAAKAATELAKQQTDTNKQGTDADKQATQQIKTDMQSMISKYPDPALAKDNDLVVVQAGATTADNKFATHDLQTLLTNSDHYLAHYVDPTTGGGLDVLHIEAGSASGDNKVVAEPLGDFWEKVWSPSDYDIFQYLQGHFRLVQSFRMDTTNAKDGYVPYLFQNVNGEIILRFRANASSGGGGSGGVAIDFSGEPDGTGIAAIGGAVKHVPVVWLKSNDVSQTYDGTLNMPSTAPADGTIYVLQIKYDAANNKYTAELKEGGSFFGIDPKTIPAGWTFDGMINLPSSLIDGCHTPKFCIDSVTKTIKLDYNVGGSGVNDTIGVIKPTKDGQVPMSGTDSTGARAFNKLYDMPLPSPTSSDIGKTLAWTAQGWQFVDMAKLDEATKQLIAGNLVQGFPQFTLAGAGSVQIPQIHIFWTNSSGSKEEKDIAAQTIAVDAAAQDLQYIFYNPATDSIQVDKTPPTLALQKSRVYLARYDAGSNVVSPYYFSTQGLQETLRTIMRETEGVKDAVITGVGGKVRVQQDNANAYAVAYHQNPTNNTNHNVIPLSTGELTLHFISTAGGNESTTQDWEFKYDNSGVLTDLPANNAAFYRIYADALGKIYVLRPTSVYASFADALNHFAEGVRSFPPPPSTHGHLQLLATVLTHNGATDFGDKGDFMIYDAGISGGNTAPTTAPSLPLGSAGTHYYQSNGSNIQLVDSPVDLSHVNNGEVLQRKTDGTLGSVPVTDVKAIPIRAKVIGVVVSTRQNSGTFANGRHSPDLILKVINASASNFTVVNYEVICTIPVATGKSMCGLAISRSSYLVSYGIHETKVTKSGDVYTVTFTFADISGGNIPCIISYYEV